MRTVGLIGGMSWHSTAEYYRVVQQTVAAQVGGHASAPLLLASLDFAEVRALQLAGDWDAAGALLAGAALRLEGAGAEAVLIATNLMHKVAPAVEAAVRVPLLHIADAVADDASECRTLGLLGTRWTMEEPFYADRLARRGFDVVTPDAATRAAVDEAIFGELTRGVVTGATRDLLRGAAAELASQGADAVVLACTELELALSPSDASVRIVDSMRAHAAAAASFVLGTARAAAAA